MKIRSDANEYHCPHCLAMFVGAGDDQFADDATDETSTECPKCKGRFVLVCIGVDLYFETSKAIDID